jgi:transposase-like protein
VTKLRREVAKLRAERDILKKAAAYFARDEATRAIGPREGPNI